MKFISLLPLAAVSTAFVVPPTEVLEQIAIEDHHPQPSWYDEVAETKDEVVASIHDEWRHAKDSSKQAWQHFADASKSTLDEAFELGGEAAESIKDKINHASYDVSSWLQTEADDIYESFDDGHHGPPKHGDGDDDHHGPPKHGGRRPHHPPHQHAPNRTIWQLISESKYTTKLAKLVGEYDDLVETLNSTKANYTLFAPTDKAFEKIPEHHHKPSKEQIEAILSYHVVPGFYPAGRVLVSHTAPTLLKNEHFGDKASQPQRIAFKITLRGLTVNFYSRIVAVDIFATNGVIHGVDSLILPPPNVLKIIDLLPGEFSTLELGLGKTGLLEELNTTHAHSGGTFFAPSNFAFQKLGPKINAFLFSSYGQKYLKALLEYHIAPFNVLYSDAYYPAKGEEDVATIPKGRFHIDLPTLLKDRSLAVDVARFGGFISIKINAFADVSVQDGVAADGVIHVVSDVLIPPKKVGGVAEFWNGGELEVEELVERLDGVMKKDL